MVEELKKLLRQTRDPYNLGLFSMGYNDGVRDCIEVVRKCQTKVIKEFADKVKEKALSHCKIINCYELTFIKTTIDDILEEYEVEE